MPPTDGYKLQNKQAHEKRREDWLVRNQEEQDARNMGVFFPDATDPIAPGISLQLHGLKTYLLYQSF